MAYFIKCSLLFLIIYCFKANAQDQTAIVGQTSQIKFNITNVVNSKICHIEVSLPDQKKINLDVEGPQFTAVIDFTPQKTGNTVIQWEGKNKFRGIYTVFACPGSGIVQVQVNGNTEIITKKWEQYFSKVSDEIKDCVKYGMELSNFKYQLSADPEADLTSPDDSKLKPIYDKCDSFALLNHPKKAMPCTNANLNNLKTLCDGAYVEKQSDGKLKAITRRTAIQLHFQGLPWSVALAENPEAKAKRLKEEDENKIKQAAEQIAKQEVEEKAKVAKLKQEEDKVKLAAEIAAKREAEEKARIAKLKQQEDDKAKFAAEIAAKKEVEEKSRVAKLKQEEDTNITKSDIDIEFKIARDFLDRNVDWLFSIKNQDNFPVYISPQEIYITQSKDLIINALLQYEEHYEGGISSVFTLKISNCFYSDWPSFTRIRHRYFSEINGKGVIIKDNVLSEETIKVNANSRSIMVWHKVASDACSKAKQITESNLQKYDIVKKQLSVLDTQAGMNLYKQYQTDDERRTKKIRLAMEDKSKRERDEKERARNKALDGKLLFAGLVNTLNTGALTGSCKSVFSHLAIYTNKLYYQTISKPAKNQDDEFRKRKEADQYLRAGELGVILSERIGNSFSEYVLPSELSDYLQSVNETMNRMQNLNDAEIAYEAYNYCRKKFW